MNPEEGKKGLTSQFRPQMKIMISAGESSGEIHGASLVRAAREKGYDWAFFGLGGDRMAGAGVRLLAHIKDTAVMGLTEVAGSLPKILRIRGAMKQALELERPDALVLIDAPDFNFALAKEATARGLPVIYYICPQVWAWRAGRLKFLRRFTNRRALLFEFEKRFYQERGVEADWVGHPIVDELPPAMKQDEAKSVLGLNPDRRLLVLMPGSRRKVVERLAPLLLAAAGQLLEKDPGLQLMLPRADSIEPAFLSQFISQASEPVRERLKVQASKSHLALAAADLALLASGTSSVEATFLGAPQVVVYKVSGLSWFLGKRLVSTPYATIANLIAGREVVPELLQDKANLGDLVKIAWPILAGGAARAKLIKDLAEVRQELGGPGASGRVVDIIADELLKARVAGERRL